jgi:hypothetical protein
MNRFTSPKTLVAILVNGICYLVFHLLQENTQLHFDATDVSAAQGIVTGLFVMFAPHSTKTDEVTQ